MLLLNFDRNLPTCITCSEPVLKPILDQSLQYCNSCINFLDQQKNKLLQRHKLALSNTICPFGTDAI